MTDEEVKKELGEIALTSNWGSVERIDGVPKPIAVIKDALALIHRLEEENKQLKEQCDDVRLYGLDMANGKIDMTLGSQNFKASINSIIQLFKQNGGTNFIATEIEVGEKLGDRYVLTIEKVGMEKYKTKIVKETAKDILTRVADITTEDHQPCSKYTWFKALAEKYGVEVKK